MINAMRKPGTAELRHADFMVKLEKHPGITERNFSGSYSDPTGRSLPCYYLPKREAELMVMSESLEVSPVGVQTKVYDAWQAAEAKGQEGGGLDLPMRRRLMGLSESARN